ncbi:MAG TPA: hypothetical protein VM866_00590 [Pyrinomonadaceae bacterium]|nr:hypothetical protein [Pyrinomonadaceae bacterium]
MWQEPCAHVPAAWGGMPAQQAILQRCPDDVRPGGTMPDRTASVSVAAIITRAAMDSAERPVCEFTCVMTCYRSVTPD